MTTKRTPLKRPLHPIINDRAVDLYARGVTLMGRKPSAEIESELSDVCLELSAVLGQKPWEADVLTDCDCKQPPAFLRGAQVDDWYKSRALREQLQLALHHRKKAER